MNEGEDRPGRNSTDGPDVSATPANSGDVAPVSHLTPPASTGPLSFLADFVAGINASVHLKLLSG